MKKIYLLLVVSFLLGSFAVQAQSPHFAQDGQLQVNVISRQAATFSGTIVGVGSKKKTAKLIIEATFEVNGTCDNPGVKPGKNGGKTFDCGFLTTSTSVDVPVDRNGRLVFSETIDTKLIASGWAYNCLDCGGQNNWSGTPPSICVSNTRIYVDGKVVEHNLNGSTCFN